jgi:hypothetical protein
MNVLSLYKQILQWTKGLTNYLDDNWLHLVQILFQDLVDSLCLPICLGVEKRQ